MSQLRAMVARPSTAQFERARELSYRAQRGIPTDRKIRGARSFPSFGKGRNTRMGTENWCRGRPRPGSSSESENCHTERSEVSLRTNECLVSSTWSRKTQKN